MTSRSASGYAAHLLTTQWSVRCPHPSLIVRYEEDARQEPVARPAEGRAPRSRRLRRSGGQPARRQVVVRDSFVPDRGVAQDQVAGLEVALQAARGADGDDGGGAQGGQFL